MVIGESLKKQKQIIKNNNIKRKNTRKGVFPFLKGKYEKVQLRSNQILVVSPLKAVKRSKCIIFLGGIFILQLYNNKKILINLEQNLKLKLKMY